MSVSGATVMVASKLHIPVDLWLKNNSGKKEVHTLRGVALRPGQSRPYIVAGLERTTKAAGEEQAFLEGAAALTPVPVEFWERWKLAYREWPPFANGHIFAHEKAESVTAMAKERRAERTGLEPIDPSNPSPTVKPFSQDD